jgi:hypothetical protein
MPAQLPLRAALKTQLGHPQGAPVQLLRNQMTCVNEQPACCRQSRDRSSPCQPCCLSVCLYVCTSVRPAAAPSLATPTNYSASQPSPPFGSATDTDAPQDPHSLGSPEGASPPSLPLYGETTAASSPTATSSSSSSSASLTASVHHPKKSPDLQAQKAAH